jgi:transposase
LETAQLVIDQNYTYQAAAKAMGMGYSTLKVWVKQLREERTGKTPTAMPMSKKQLEILELKKRIELIQLDKEIMWINGSDYPSSRCTGICT